MHNSGVEYLTSILLAYQDVVQYMPMFRSWVFPGRLESGLLLKEGVGYSQGELCTELQQQYSIVVVLADSMLS